MGIKERWNRSKPLPPDIRERIAVLPSLFQEKGVELAYLFGSLVNSAGNDVDIALLYKGDFDDIRKEIQKRLGTSRLDIVNLKTAPLHVCFEVISNITSTFIIAEVLHRLMVAEAIEKKFITLEKSFGIWAGGPPSKAVEVILPLSSTPFVQN